MTEKQKLLNQRALYQQRIDEMVHGQQYADERTVQSWRNMLQDVQERLAAIYAAENTHKFSHRKPMPKKLAS